MLVNNFKPLLFFGNNLGTFKNVLGNDVSVKDFLGKLTLTDTRMYGASDNYMNIINNHTLWGISRSFNYDITTSTNSCTDEQTTYGWQSVVIGVTGYNLPMQECGFTMFVGTGNTAVTASDYKLDTPLTLDVLSASCIQNSDGTVEVQRTFKNNTGNDVVIKEKGLYVFSGKGTTTFNAPVPIVMIGRKVLDAPVTIPDGGVYTFTTTIDMSQITFSEADS